MNSDVSKRTELDQKTAKALVRRAKQTSYYAHLAEFLSNHLREQVSGGNVRAFEREDGIRVVAITDAANRDTLPQLGLSFAFEGETIVHAVAEDNTQSSNGVIKIIYPTELAPALEEDSADIVRSFGSLDDLTIRECENVTVYEITLP